LNPFFPLQRRLSIRRHSAIAPVNSTAFIAAMLKRFDDIHKAVRPTPAIIAAPPLAVHGLPNHIAVADIIGAEAVVFGDALSPGF
jgi:hypothetical protein